MKEAKRMENGVIDVTMNTKTLLKIINGNFQNVSVAEFQYSSYKNSETKKKVTLEISTLLSEKKSKLNDKQLYHPNLS